MTAWGWTVSNDASNWYVVNDTVMGGVSSSSLGNTESGSLLFSGFLSLENNGGFTSTRTESVPLLQDGLDTLTVRVRGDGRNYIATIRTPYRSMRRVYYRQEFETVADKVVEVELKAEDFKAYTFGRRVPSAPTLAEVGPNIGSIGFMLADKKPGPFALQIISIDGVSSARDGTASLNVRDLLSLAVSRGVPLFNNGYPEQCAEIYETALSTLLLDDYELTESQRSDTTQALKTARAEPSQSEKAWILRRAIDRRLTE
jgi:monofunctional biosynthetic peptidoglycan transglycosylase